MDGSQSPRCTVTANNNTPTLNTTSTYTTNKQATAAEPERFARARPRILVSGEEGANTHAFALLPCFACLALGRCSYHTCTHSQPKRLHGAGN
jgi:hypothetical protein